jgi:hypothetical protein
MDAYFMEHRARLIDIAAFLDRLDRAADAGPSGDDFRAEAFRQAISMLTDGRPQRARRILDHFSDLTTTPIDRAPMKGALGAYGGQRP